jgi:hypothetical protein
MAELIRSLLAPDIDEHIEEVIKVDQDDGRIVRQEIRDYVVTNSIKRHMVGLLDRYAETPNKPHEGIGVWVSGFFGSGKSSFAKVLGYAVGNRIVDGARAAALLAERANDDKTKLLLDLINEKIATHTVVFDISTARSIRHSGQPLTEIMYSALLRSLGYPQNIDLAELEIALEEEGQLDRFRDGYLALHKKEWDEEKGLVSFAFNRASAVMHALDDRTYPLADSWVKGAQNRADLSPARLAERCVELMRRRRPDAVLMFVVDEVGQFVAKDAQKMLELQGIVQALGVQGRGRIWLVVTSQERLNEVVSGVDDRRIELARLMDRFPLQVHLETSDIAEVTGRRVLQKNSKGQDLLRPLFETWRGRLSACTRPTGGRSLTELSAEGFINLYPLLPYQIDLAIDIVSGLRTAGGAGQHVGGANRTIIKLAHALLVDPRAGLADRTVGRLATLDLIYDLVEGNISSDIRAKIASVPERDRPVAKVICLLQYARSVPATAENIAVALHPSVDADSLLPEVRRILQALVDGQFIRASEQGYRIPTPAEDDWDRIRRGITIRGNGPRILASVLKGFWEQAPQHILGGTKAFKAGLVVDGRPQVDGDIVFHLNTAQQGAELAALGEDLRTRSQRETKDVFWAVPLDADIEREVEEVFRSTEMLNTRGRAADADGKLVGEERHRLTHHEGELKRRLRAATLKGAAFFRGHDRHPSDRAADTAKAAADILGRVLPDVFHRFAEAAAKVSQSDIDSLLKSDNLHGLTAVFARMGLLEDKNGIPAFRTDSGPLKEVLARIENRTSYGETASGHFLSAEFAKEPFGWDFDVVRLLVASLLRAGCIEATAQGRSFDSALSVEAKTVFTNNPQFRSAAFRPKVGLEPEHIIQAAANFEAAFGQQIAELTETAVAGAIRRRLTGEEAGLQEQYDRLVRAALPGALVLRQGLDEVRAVLRGTDAQAIQGFNAAHSTIREAIKRAGDLATLLTEIGIRTVADAREAQGLWEEVVQQAEVDPTLQAEADELADLLGREDFFRDITRIGVVGARLAAAHGDLWNAAHAAAVSAYGMALDALTSHPAWARLAPEDRERLSRPLSDRQIFDPSVSIATLRAEQSAAPARGDAAIAEMLHILEGERLVTLNLRTLIADGIDSEGELEAALDAIRTEVAPLLAQGKKVFLR